MPQFKNALSDGNNSSPQPQTTTSLTQRHRRTECTASELKMAARRKEDVGGARYAVESVDKMSTILRQMLERGSLVVKDSTGIEPALTNSDLLDLLQNVESFQGGEVKDQAAKTRNFSAIETAVRDIFNELLASYSIDDPSFVHLWNLLDIVSILADTERCEPPLVFHLIEELLDSQTVAGCRKIFDYLESRRERIIAKHFALKNLVILRSCNELLRRLSRAEDTAFCGRVFIFLFQSFPLGDKSAVNLRGEYHVENATIFDELPPSSKPSPDAMQVDSEEPTNQDEKKNATGAVSTPKPVDDSKLHKGSPSVKGVTFDAKVPAPAEKPKDPDTLYPIFWSLQHSFNQPKKLFDPDHFASFKSGLEDTMVLFKSVPNTGNSVTTKTQNEKQTNTEARGTKRKRSSSNDDLASTFNPKYLTSRDLFELEISDLSFRRHILVQALIILDFLLSLSPKAKEKLATVTPQNKSVMYSEQVISEEDTKWALDMKKQIAEYLKVGLEGAFFLRMVETVLSRDKNWVRWKMESCPSIQKPAVNPEDVVSAKAAAQKATMYRPIRPKPLKSLDLGFLTETSGGLERLKNPDRYRLPTLASFEKAIADDDFEIGMTNDPEVKQRFLNAKASKTWRALRIASKTKLSLFSEIEDTTDIKKIFDDNSAPKPADSVDKEAAEGEEAMEVDNSSDPATLKDRRPIVICVQQLTIRWGNRPLNYIFRRNPNVLAKPSIHWTRKEGEQQHVTPEEFGLMCDNDEFLAYYKARGGESVGITKKAIEAVIASGKVPVIVLPAHPAMPNINAKAMPARFILITQPGGKVPREGLFDCIIYKDSQKRVGWELENHIFGREKNDDSGLRGGGAEDLDSDDIDDEGDEFDMLDWDSTDGKGEDIIMADAGPGDKIPSPTVAAKVETDSKTSLVEGGGG